MGRSLWGFLLLVLLQISFAASGTNFKLMTMPDESEGALVDLLDSAKSEIKMVMFHLSNPKIVDEIIELGRRGVHVQLLLDQKILQQNSSQNALSKIKNSVGARHIEIRKSTTGFSITHAKALMIDGQRLFVSSINFSYAIRYSRDFGLLWSDSDDLREFDSVFENDWRLAGGDLQRTPKLNSPRLIWSPVNSSEKIINLIGKANRSLFVEIENLGSNEVLQALSEAAKRGVDVKMILSLCTEGQGDRNWDDLKQLARAGVKIQVMPESRDQDHPYIHAKMIIADEHLFYVGSENFSNNSLNRAREVGVLSESVAVSREIARVFAADWDHSKPWGSVKRHCQTLSH